MTTAPQEPYVLVIRPDPAGWLMVQELREVMDPEHIVHSPVMKISFTNDPIDLTGISHLIFTSQNGVESFLRLSQRRDIPCLTVGDKTTALAATAGLVAQKLGDTVAEFINAISHNPPVIQSLSAAPALYVRGAHVRTDLRAALAPMGLPIRNYIGYAQQALDLTIEARSLLLREAPVVIPLFSARSARLLFQNQPIRAKLYVCAISEFVVANVPQVRKLVIAPRPDAEAMRVCVLKLLKNAKRLEGSG